MYVSVHAYTAVDPAAERLETPWQLTQQSGEPPLPVTLIHRALIFDTLFLTGLSNPLWEPTTVCPHATDT